MCCATAAARAGGARPWQQVGRLAGPVRACASAHGPVAVVSKAPGAPNSSSPVGKRSPSSPSGGWTSHTLHRGVRSANNVAEGPAPPAHFPARHRWLFALHCLQVCFCAAALAPHRLALTPRNSFIAVSLRDRASDRHGRRWQASCGGGGGPGCLVGRCVHLCALMCTRRQTLCMVLCGSASMDSAQAVHQQYATCSSARCRLSAVDEPPQQAAAQPPARAAEPSSSEGDSYFEGSDDERWAQLPPYCM